MNENVVRFFKRNPEAKAAHLVLDLVVGTAKHASRLKRFYSAKKVDVFTREEYDQWVTANKNAPSTETGTTPGNEANNNSLTKNEQ